MMAYAGFSSVWAILTLILPGGALYVYGNNSRQSSKWLVTKRWWIETERWWTRSKLSWMPNLRDCWILRSFLELNLWCILLWNVVMFFLNLCCCRLLGGCVVAKMACECHGHSGWTHLDEFWWNFNFWMNIFCCCLILLRFWLMKMRFWMMKNIIWFCLKFCIGNIYYMGFMFFIGLEK